MSEFALKNDRLEKVKLHKAQALFLYMSAHKYTLIYVLRIFTHQITLFLTDSKLMSKFTHQFPLIKN